MKKFYLGMDIGTESVGMACTDEQYNLLRGKGKDLWAVRLFDEAKDALERRTKRTARRRLQRRRQRIEFLQGVFAPFMEDANFFLRLNNSGFYEEDKDKKLATKFSLFADVGYTDIDFYHDFPTIFHLRRALLEGTDKKIDLRHYYLALHHIIKYRGHFLFEGENIGDIHDIKKLFQAYNACIYDMGIDDSLVLSTQHAENFRVLATARKGLDNKKKEAWVMFGETSAALKGVIALLLGAKVKATTIFGEEYAEKYKDEKISFKEWNDEVFEQKQELFEPEHYTLIMKARDIYNFIIFEKLLGGNFYVSQAMVALYEKHQNDLKLLKKFIKQNYSQEVYSKEEDAIAAPRKNCAPYTQTKKYGGFKSLTTAYFVIVQSKDKKGNMLKTIEAIPVLVDYQSKNNKDAITQYLTDKGLIEPKMLVSKLKVKSLVAINGYKAWMAGITGKQIIIHNAQQWFTDSKTDLVLIEEPYCQYAAFTLKI